MTKILLLFFSFLSVNLYSQKVAVNGTVKLKNQANYSKISVIFRQISPGVTTDTVFSDLNGKYNFAADQGLYNIDFYKQGYDKITYSNVQLFSDKMLADTTLSLHRTFVTVPADFDSVYKAANYVLSGDTIIIFEGLYKESISITQKGILIASKYLLDNDTSHFSKTILSGGGTKQIMNIASPNLTNRLVGLTFSNGLSKRYGGAVNCQGNLTISNCKFENNSAISNSDPAGGAICITKGNLDVTNSQFIKCLTSNPYSYQASSGGAISLQYNCTANFKNCMFSGNSSAYFGGAFESYSSSTSFDSCTFTDNKSTQGYAAAIFIAGTSFLEIKNCAFTNNTGTYIISSINNSGYRITNSILRGNTGSLFDFYNSKGKTENCIISGNSASGNLMVNDVTPFYNCLFAYNNAGAAFAGTFTNCSFYKNTFTNKSSASKVLYSSIFPKNQFTFTDPLITLLVKKNNNGDSCDFYKNLTSDPLFVDTISLIPSAISPLVDAGINDSAHLFKDYSGKYRFFDGNNDSIAIVDMGPNEVNSSLNHPVFTLGKKNSFCKGDTLHFSIPVGFYKTIWLNDTTYGNSKKIFKPGIYYAKALNDGFLLFSDTLEVTESPIPTVKINKTILNDTLIKLQTTTTFESYLWNTGSTEPTINVGKSQFTSNTLNSWVTIKDINGCKNSDTIKLLKSDITAVQEILNSKNNGSSGLKIYPLPATEMIFIDYPEATTEMLYIGIYDISGKLVYSKNTSGSKEIPVEISTLKAGYYIVQLNQGSKKLSGYLVKK